MVLSAPISQDALVSDELLLFCRLLFAVEVYEFGAEQAYAFSIVLVDGAQIGGTADVGINVYACAIEGYAGFALEFLKQSQFLDIFRMLSGQGLHQIVGGLDVYAAVVAVEDSHLAIPAVIDILALDQ